MSFLDFLMPQDTGLSQSQIDYADRQGLFQAAAQLANLSAPRIGGVRATPMQLITGGLAGYGQGAQGGISQYYENQVNQGKVGKAQLEKYNDQQMLQHTMSLDASAPPPTWTPTVPSMPGTAPTLQDFYGSGSLTPAQIKQESGGNPNAVSPKGAVGLMQLMPGTQKDPGFGIKPLQNNSPEENVRLGSQYTEALTQKYNGNQPLALMAYNWGPGNVDKWIASGGKPEAVPKETVDYVTNVLQNAQGGAVNPALPATTPATNVRGPQGQPAVPGINAQGDKDFMYAAAPAAQVAAGGMPTAPGVGPAQANMHQQLAVQLRQEGLWQIQHGNTAGGQAILAAAETYDPQAAYSKAYATARGNTEGSMLTGLTGGAAGAGGSPSGVTGEAYLKQLPPTLGSQVKALAEGRMQFPSGFALKSPYWQQMLQAVSIYDPGFDAINYNARAKTRADFTSGKSASNITALETAINHLAELQDANEKLGGAPIGNTAINYAKNAMSNTALVNYNTIAKTAADEVSKATAGPGGSALADREERLKEFTANQSPDARKAAILAAIKLLNGRLEPLANTYNTGMGTSKDGLDLLSPKARIAYKKLTGVQEPLDNATQLQQPAAAGAPKIKFLGFE